MTLREPSSFADLAVVRLLFEEYRTSLGIDLCFQGFDAELATLPGAYGRPRGRIWLAMLDGEAAGCVGLRPHEADACEMKGLYVRPAPRGQGIGGKLARKSIEGAEKVGYRKMYIDTPASKGEAAPA